MSLGEPDQNYTRLTPLEVATATVVGWSQVDAPRETVAKDPLEALERALLPALLHPPCVVAFSGGRDSSAVLAVALRVARREGLAMPIALTRRWPGYPATDESYWQELAVSALGVRDWERMDFDENDVIGPTAQDSLMKRGILWPPLAYSWPRLVAKAAGGSFVTGEGGDEMFGPRRCSGLRYMSKGFTSQRAKHALVSVAPRRARVVAQERHHRGNWSWLRPEARRLHLRLVAEEQASEPFLWPASLRWHLGRRMLTVAAHNLTELAGEHRAKMFHPLLDPGFVSALGHRSGPLGFAGRGEAMAAVFGDLLPRELVYRSTKALTTTSLFGDWSRAFVNSWEGGGLDEAIVDTQELRQAWAAPSPAVGSVLLLQQAWLSGQRKSANTRSDGRSP